MSKMSESTPEALPPPPPIVPPNLIPAKVLGTEGQRTPLLTDHFKVQLEHTTDCFSQVTIGTTKKNKSRESFNLFSGGGKKAGVSERTNNKDRKRVREEAISSSIVDVLPASVEGKYLERIKRMNLELDPVRGDGNCLYRAVARVEYGHEKEFETAKKEIIKQMLDNLDLYMAYGVTLKIASANDKALFKEYVNNLNKPGEWGEYLTLYAAANRYQCRIHLVCSMFDDDTVALQEIIPADGHIEKEVYMGYIYKSDTEGHYDALEGGQSVPPAHSGPSRILIIIRNLPDYVTLDTFSGGLTGFGAVEDAVLIKNLGVGYAEMRYHADMNKAIEALNGKFWGAATERRLSVIVGRASHFDKKAK